MDKGGELRQLNQRTRKLIMMCTMTLHPRNDMDGIYVSREGGGLTNSEGCRETRSRGVHSKGKEIIITTASIKRINNKKKKKKTIQKEKKREIRRKTTVWILRVKN